MNLSVDMMTLAQATGAVLACAGATGLWTHLMLSRRSTQLLAEDRERLAREDGGGSSWRSCLLEQAGLGMVHPETARTLHDSGEIDAAALESCEKRQTEKHRRKASAVAFALALACSAIGYACTGVAGAVVGSLAALICVYDFETRTVPPLPSLILGVAACGCFERDVPSCLGVLAATFVFLRMGVSMLNSFTGGSVYGDGDVALTAAAAPLAVPSATLYPAFALFGVLIVELAALLAYKAKVNTRHVPIPMGPLYLPPILMCMVVSAYLCAA